MKLYTNWLLEDSIATSFNAFKRGFDLVMSHTFLADLFTAEEVEMLICGCNVRSSLPLIMCVCVCDYVCLLVFRNGTLMHWKRVHVTMDSLRVTQLLCKLFLCI